MVKLQLKSYMVAFPRPYPTKPYGCIYGESMKNMISKINAGCQKRFKILSNKLININSGHGI